MKSYTCTTCNTLKLRNEFPPSNHTRCRVCNRKNQKRFRQTEQFKETLKTWAKKNYQRHRDKQLARGKLRYAVKIGIIQKPSDCQGCSQELPLQGHHDDYDKPLEVIWLCDICHKHKDDRLMDKSLLRRVQ